MEMKNDMARRYALNGRPLKRKAIGTKSAKNTDKAEKHV
jgi:hypothetical protein